MKAAANRPAEVLVVISLVNRYAAKAVKPEKAGANKTQMFLISTGIVRARRAW